MINGSALLTKPLPTVEKTMIRTWKVMFIYLFMQNLSFISELANGITSNPLIT